MDVQGVLKNIAIGKVVNYRNVEVEGICADSRTLKKGDLYVCLRGGKADGHLFVGEAEEKGAVAIVSEQEVESSLPQFIVKNTRKALALIAGNFYRNPASDLHVVTVVGTNGKTSTVEILSRIFSYAGLKTATIGTLGFMIDGQHTEGALTTPDPIDLHRKLREMADCGVKYVFMEASAHAIYYDKLAGIKAKATVFTNITQDHLDFFRTMEEYSAVKLSYFNHENTALAVVNSDDPYGVRLITSHPVPTISYGIDNPADVFAINLNEEEDGLSFTMNAFDCIEEIRCPLFGRFNVYNVMAATATAMYMGIGIKTVARALASMPTVPGRYDVKYLQGRRVIVDYAHTPDGLENLLSDVKERYAGKVITVFGCGGNRDKSKRPLMGNVASTYSDRIIITDDNPRDEEEIFIAEDVKKGIPLGAEAEILLDREEAIRRAFLLSSQGDTIVIAGKGHERTMEKKGVKSPYSDYAVLEKLSR